MLVECALPAEGAPLHPEEAGHSALPATLRPTALHPPRPHPLALAKPTPPHHPPSLPSLPPPGLPAHTQASAERSQPASQPASQPQPRPLPWRRCAPAAARACPAAAAAPGGSPPHRIQCAPRPCTTPAAPPPLQRSAAQAAVTEPAQPLSGGGRAGGRAGGWPGGAAEGRPLRSVGSAKLSGPPAVLAAMHVCAPSLLLYGRLPAPGPRPHPLSSARRRPGRPVLRFGRSSSEESLAGSCGRGEAGSSPSPSSAPSSPPLQRTAGGR